MILGLSLGFCVNGRWYFQILRKNEVTFYDVYYVFMFHSQLCLLYLKILNDSAVLIYHYQKCVINCKDLFPEDTTVCSEWSHCLWSFEKPHCTMLQWPAVKVKICPHTEIKCATSDDRLATSSADIVKSCSSTVYL